MAQPGAPGTPVDQLINGIEDTLDAVNGALETAESEAVKGAETAQSTGVADVKAALTEAKNLLDGALQKAHVVKAGQTA